MGVKKLINDCGSNIIVTAITVKKSFYPKYRDLLDLCDRYGGAYCMNGIGIRGKKHVVIDRRCFDNKSYIIVLCHELGHAIGEFTEGQLDEEIRAWENAYGLYKLYFPNANEKLFFDDMIDSLATYGWEWNNEII